MSQCDVAIIGAGCVGAFCAMHLSKYNVAAVVLERSLDAASGTTNANSGIVHSGHNTTPNTVKASYVDRGNELICEYAGQMNFGFRKCGELVVARSEEEYPALLKMKAYSESIGVPCEEWDAARIRAEEPNLNEIIKHALFVPSAGVVNPYEMAVAALNTAQKNGVQVHFNTEVVDINKINGVFEIETKRGKIISKLIINAAGLFADQIARMVDPNTKINIHPRKGEEYLLNKDFSDLVKRIIFPIPTGQSKGTLVIPTVDGTIMVGPTAVDQTDKNDFSTTQYGMAAVFAAVKQLVPKIDPSMMISSFAGLRAVDASSDFVIDCKDGFINLAGMQSPGLTASPAIGLDATKMVLDCLKISVESVKQEWKFAKLAEKFGRVSMERRKEFVNADANHSKIVCSCELVTEADVQNAITEGARTMDGVKIRTRAGMGGCQGGFCTTRIQGILADRLQVNLENITKRNYGTELCCNEIGKERVDIEDLAALPIKQYQPVPIEHTEIQVICSEERKSNVRNKLELQKIPLFDVVIIGAGPAGLAAGLEAAKKNPQLSVLLIEKGERSGGILIQCIHGGFGLKRYQQELTGPEYSEMLANECVGAGANIVLNAYVQRIDVLDEKYELSCVIQGLGFKTIHARALINTAGCRERTRFGVRISGTRPSGVYNAGLAQAMINLEGQLPGKKIAILGSGDIGLIMARRVTLEGAKVVGVFEIMPFVAGLKRNLAQCLEDYCIPYHLSQSCIVVNGMDRVESIEFAEVDSKLQPTGKTQIVDCDCVLLAVGLIPITNFSVQVGGRLHEKTKNPLVDSFRALKGNAFAAGNCLQVHDLADDAAEEGTVAGMAAVAALTGVFYQQKVQIVAGANVGGCVPEIVYKDAKEQQFVSLRVRQSLGHAVVKAVSNGVIIGETEVEDAVPAEMVHVNIPLCKLSGLGEKIEMIAESLPQDNKETGISGNVKQLTCIVCPRGCKISVKTNQNNDIEEITGFTCKRGQEFAIQEHAQPFRVFSSTVKLIGCKNIRRLPIKLSKPVPRASLLEVADAIKTVQLSAPVKMGDIVAKNIGGFQGVNLIACCSARNE